MKRRIKKKRDRDKNVNQPSDLGRVVDMPFEKFKDELVKQQVNVGTMNNLILLLSSTYNDLRNRKEAVMNLVFSGKETESQVAPYLKAIYAEMTKLEQKIVYLKTRVKELLDSV